MMNSSTSPGMGVLLHGQSHHSSPNAGLNSQGSSSIKSILSHSVHSSSSPGLCSNTPGSFKSSHSILSHASPSPRLFSHTPSSIKSSQGHSHCSTPSPRFCFNTPSSIKSSHGSHHATPNSPSPGFHTFKTPGKCAGHLHKSPLSATPSEQWKHSGASQLCTPTSCMGPTPNPFEGGWVNRLHMPAFSPSVFAKTSTPSSEEKTQKSFRWSIDQLAVLHPADIDEMPLQDTASERHDDESEEKIQRAIDTFFASNLIAPSPWTASATRHKARLLYGNAGSMPSSATGSPAVKPATIGPRPYEGSQNVACQTALTLPVDFDLEKVLGEFYQPQLMEEGCQDILSTSSLRRKLFFHGENDCAPSPVKSPTAHSSMAMHCGYDSPQVSPVKLTTPQQQKTNHTPGSNQFSSSPILFSKKCNERTPNYEHGSFGHDHMTSPELSPIGFGKLSRVIPHTPPSGHIMTATPSTGRKTLSFDSPDISPIRSSERSRCGNNADRHTSPGNFHLKDGDDYHPITRSQMSPDIGDYHHGSRQLSESTRHFPHMDLDDSGHFALEQDQNSGTDMHIAPDGQYYECHSPQRLFNLSTIGENSAEDESSERTGNEAGCTASLTNQDTGYCTQSLQSTNHDTGLHTNLTTQMNSLPLGLQDTGLDSSSTCSSANTVETSLSSVSSIHGPGSGLSKSSPLAQIPTYQDSPVLAKSYPQDPKFRHLFLEQNRHPDTVTEKADSSDIKVNNDFMKNIADEPEFEFQKKKLDNLQSEQLDVSYDYKVSQCHYDRPHQVGTPPVLSMSIDCESPCTPLSRSARDNAEHYYFGSDRDMGLSVPCVKASHQRVKHVISPIRWDLDNDCLNENWSTYRKGSTGFQYEERNSDLGTVKGGEEGKTNACKIQSVSPERS